jgi:predicted acyltransferase
MSQRFYSLDIFRGATVALMILVNTPGSWDHIFAPLEHASWHGCTPTDLVFPFFLFAVGNAMAFVLPKFSTGSHGTFLKKIIKRTLLIFTIGVLLNWCPFFKWSNNQLVVKPWAFINANGIADGVRILGVLQRIAICYFFAAIIIHFFKAKGALLISGILLLSYWAICVLLNPTNPFSITGYFGRAVDIAILGKAHMLHIDTINGQVFHFDYEGLTSTIGAIVQVLFGYFAGIFIITKGKTAHMLNTLFVTAVALLFVGFCWDMVFPINKKIWSSSYTIYTTGLALLVLSMLIYAIEFKKYTGWATSFFNVFGKNALFIFVLSGALPRLLGLVRIPDGLNEFNKPIYLSPLGWLYQHFFKLILPADARIGSLLYAIFFILIMWLAAYWLDKKKIYIKV